MNKSNNYLKKPILYQTGFILDDRNIRRKEGLLPQNLSNNAFIGVDRAVNNDYYRGFNIVERDLIKNPYYNNRFFPILEPNVDYNKLEYKPYI